VSVKKTVNSFSVTSTVQNIDQSKPRPNPNAQYLYTDQPKTVILSQSFSSREKIQGINTSVEQHHPKHELKTRNLSSPPLSLCDSKKAEQLATNSLVKPQAQAAEKEKSKKNFDPERDLVVQNFLKDTTLSTLDKLKSLLPIPESLTPLMNMFLGKGTNTGIKVSLENDSLKLMADIKMPAQGLQGAAILSLPVIKQPTTSAVTELHPIIIEKLSKPLNPLLSEKEQVKGLIQLISTLPSEVLSFTWSNGSADIAITLPNGASLKLTLKLPTSKESEKTPDILRTFLKTILKENYAGIETLLSKEMIFNWDGSTSRFEIRFPQQLALHIQEISSIDISNPILSKLVTAIGSKSALIIPPNIRGAVNFKNPSIQFDIGTKFIIKNALIPDISIDQISYDPATKKMFLTLQTSWTLFPDALLKNLEIDLKDSPKQAPKKDAVVKPNIVKYEFVPIDTKIVARPEVSVAIAPKSTISVFESLKQLIKIPKKLEPLIEIFFADQTKLDVNLSIEDSLAVSVDNLNIPKLGITGKASLKIPTQSKEEKMPVTLLPEIEEIFFKLGGEKLQPKFSEKSALFCNLFDLALTLPNQNIRMQWEGNTSKATLFITLPGGMELTLELDVKEIQAEHDTLRMKLLETLDSPLELSTKLLDVLCTIGKHDPRRAQILTILNRKNNKELLRTEFEKMAGTDFLRAKLSEILGDQFAEIEPFLSQRMSFKWDGENKRAVLEFLGINSKVSFLFPKTVAAKDKKAAELHPQVKKALTKLVSSVFKSSSADHLIDLILTMSDQNICIDWWGDNKQADIAVTLPGGMLLKLELDMQKIGEGNDILRTKLGGEAQEASQFYFPRMPKEIQRAIHVKPPHLHFVGRTKLLQDLAKALLADIPLLSNQSKIHVLYGPGGIGKSELAISFANHHLDDFSLLWTISCGTSEEMAMGYRLLANTLKVYLENHDSQEIIVQKVHNRLAQNTGKPWLIIFDNLNDSVPLPERGGVVLITSYRKKPGVEGAEVLPFSPEEALELLQTVTKQNSPHFTRLLEFSGCYPLLLGQIGSYLARTGMPIEEYISLLEKQVRPIEQSERNPKTLEVAIKLTLERLPPSALKWLFICSHLNASAIPLAYLEDWLKSAGYQDRAALILQREEIKTALVEHALLRFDPEMKMFSMHLDIKKVLQPKAMLTFFNEAVKILVAFSSELSFDTTKDWAKTMREATEWVSHTNEILKIVEQTKDTAFLLMGMGTWEYARGHYLEALKYNTQALEIRKAALGGKHPNVATSLNDIANCYYYQGNYAEALKLYSQALEIRKAALGDKHPDVATSLNCIANCYNWQGNYAEALKLYSQALEIRKAALGDEHTYVGASLKGMANCYYSQGNYAEALKMHSQVLKIRKAALGDKHPYVATSLNHLANCYNSQGNYAETSSCSRRHLEIGKAALGDKHPDVATSLSGMACCYYCQGNYAEALKLYSQALEIGKAALGDKHPDVATSLESMANCYNSQGNYAEALKLYSQALEIRKAALGGKHPDMAMSLNNMATCYYCQGNYAEALKLYSQALEIGKAALGDKHPDVAASLSGIANCYNSQGNYAEALELYSQAIEIQKGALGDKHPDVARSLSDMANCYYSQWNYAEALKLFTQALEIAKVALGDKHPNVAICLSNIERCRTISCSIL